MQCKGKSKGGGACGMRPAKGDDLCRVHKAAAAASSKSTDNVRTDAGAEAAPAPAAAAAPAPAAPVKLSPKLYEVPRRKRAAAPPSRSSEDRQGRSRSSEDRQDGGGVVALGVALGLGVLAVGALVLRPLLGGAEEPQQAAPLPDNVRRLA